MILLCPSVCPCLSPSITFDPINGFSLILCDYNVEGYSTFLLFNSIQTWRSYEILRCKRHLCHLMLEWWKVDGGGHRPSNKCSFCWGVNHMWNRYSLHEKLQTWRRCETPCFYVTTLLKWDSLLAEVLLKNVLLCYTFFILSRWVPEALTLRVKWPGREAYHSSPSSVDVWIIPPPLQYIFMKRWKKNQEIPLCGVVRS